MSARLLRAAALASAVLALGACDLIVKAAYGDRHVDPTITCASGVCICVAGRGDCDDDPDNGCEADLSMAPNCGDCGNTCDNGTCEGGSCACSPGFDDCNGAASDGCEVNLQSDPNNCGVCGKLCSSGVCTGGQCKVTASGVYPGGETLTLLASPYVLVGGCKTPPLLAVDLDQGTTFTAAKTTGCAHAVTTASNRTLWLSDDAVLSALTGPPFGATPTALVTGITGNGRLAASATQVYWEDLTPGMGQRLMRVPMTGGAAVAIASDQVLALVADDASAYWSSSTGLHSVPDGDTAITDIDPTVPASALALDTQSLYAVSGQSLLVYPLAGGSPKPVSLPTAVQAIAVDGGLVYWLGADGNVMRMDLAGGAAELLASGQSFAETSPIAVDAASVYWLAVDGLRRVDK